MSNTSEPPGKGEVALRWFTAFAALVAAAVSLIAYVFSTPLDFSNKVRSLTHGYSVSISQPKALENVNHWTDISGTAELDETWSLLVLVQTPDEMKYYFAGPGSVSVTEKGAWRLTKVPFGSQNVRLRPADLGKDYRIIALLIDEEGQRQVQEALAKKPPDDMWMSSLPHNAGKAVLRVHLAS